MAFGTLTTNAAGQAVMPTSSFNVNPQPQSGQGPFGAVPGSVGLPSPFADLSAIYPNLGATNQAASSALMDRLKGQLSPDTLTQIQNMAAALGVKSGMPGFPAGSLNTNNLLATVGRTSQDLQQQGLQDYSSLIPTISQTQTVNPALQAQIAESNAIMAAAPNPQASASYAQSLFDKYLQELSGPAGGTGVSRGAIPLGPSTTHTFNGLPGPSGMNYNTPIVSGPIGPTSEPSPSPSFNQWYRATFGTSPMQPGYDSSGAYYDPYLGE